MNIYVSNLGFDVQDQDLRELFAPFGEVSSAKIITDRETGRSRGFGFVEMADEGAKQALAELNDSSVNGRNIKVVEARPKEDRPARNSGGGGGGYRGNNPFKNKW